jgi:hypothetical protein
MLQHMPVNRRAYNRQPKRQTRLARVEWLHHLHTQTLLWSCNTPSWTHQGRHDHSTRRHYMSCLAKGLTKVDARMEVAWDAALERDACPNGLQQSRRA